MYVCACVFVPACHIFNHYCVFLALERLGLFDKLFDLHNDTGTHVPLRLMEITGLRVYAAKECAQISHRNVLSARFTFERNPEHTYILETT